MNSSTSTLFKEHNSFAVTPKEFERETYTRMIIHEKKKRRKILKMKKEVGNRV